MHFPEQPQSSPRRTTKRLAALIQSHRRKTLVAILLSLPVIGTATFSAEIFAQDHPSCSPSTDRWLDEGILRIAYRRDAVPFSYSRSALAAAHATAKRSNTDPPPPNASWEDAAGFSVDLCKEVLNTINDRRSASEHTPIKVMAYLVEPSERFRRLAAGEFDMICGATSVTLQRTKCIDFSLFTFISGASFMYRTDDNLSTLQDLVGRRVGVLIGGTSEHLLRQVLRDANVPVSDQSLEAQTTVGSVALENSVDVKHVPDYIGAMDMLLTKRTEDEGSRSIVSDGPAFELDALFADREILMYLITRVFRKRPGVNPAYLTASSLSFSYEPYAIAIRRENPLLRFYVNKTLLRLYSSDVITTIINGAFGPNRKSELLSSLYQLQRIPEQRGVPVCEER